MTLHSLCSEFESVRDGGGYSDILWSRVKVKMKYLMLQMKRGLRVQWKDFSLKKTVIIIIIINLDLLKKTLHSSVFL